jgi:stress response protein SCP2
LNPIVKYIWAVINIYTRGQTFADVKGAFCRLFDANLRNYAVIIYQKIRITLALGALCAALLNIRMVEGFNQKDFL